MSFINTGYGNIVSSEKVVAIVSVDSAPIKRLIKEAKEKGKLIDSTEGRKTMSVVICKGTEVILSALQAKTLAGRI